MLWFENKKRAKIEAQKCKIWPDFFAVFIDDIRILEFVVELVREGQ